VNNTAVAGEDDGARKAKKEAARLHNEKIREFQNDEKHLLVYTDGSLRVIHGFRRVGTGVVIYNKKEEVYAQARGLGARAEVYDGEMAGLWLGARAAMDYASKNPMITHVHFFADNSAAINTIFDPQLRPCQLYAESFTRRMTEFLDGNIERTVEVAWVPGHCSVKGNDRADVLAKRGVELGTRMQGTRSNAMRRAKEKTLSKWTAEWKATVRRGGFGDANRIPPKSKPTKLFKETSREVFGRIVQCRTGHGYIGEYYSRMHIDEKIDCPCGEDVQTREHILCECPSYNEHQYILKKVSRDVGIQEILGTKKGLEALAEFLEISGAFTRNGWPFNKERVLPTFSDEPNVEIEDEWDSEDDDD
jgi:ribonuclease HI